MKISQEVRDFARLQNVGASVSAVIPIQTALAEKAMQFREGGGEIYV